MKKAKSLFSAFALLIIFSAFIIEEPGSRTKSPVVNQASLKSSTSAITLTVACLSNRTQPLGGSFQHRVKLMNGTTPISDAQIKINDPIGRICTWVTTNSKGEAIWSRTIPLDTKLLCYSIEFYYGSLKQYSGVSITSPSDAIVLPSYTMTLNSSGVLDDRTLVMASRGGFTSTLQDIKTTLKEAVKFGDAVARDYLKNPFNKSALFLAGISCIAAPGNPVCVAAVSYSLKEILKSEWKVFGNKFIDSIVESKETKELLKNMLDLSTIAISVALLAPGEGLSNLEAISTGYEFIGNAYKQYIYLDGKLKGASFSAQKKGSDQVYMMCIYNRDSTNQIAGQPSKDPNCKENNTGDYCFQNNTILDLEVMLMSSPSKKFSSTSPFFSILQPGQKQSFFDVPAGAARYSIKTPASFSGYGSVNPQKTYSAEGSLYIEQCQENTFFINFEPPSYSSNIPTQTTEGKSQTSKDPDCKENNTGDYCFQNTTKLDLEVTFMSSPSKTRSYTSPFTCTLQPGQRQCFFNVPAGAARYEIKTPAMFNGYGSTNVPKSYFAEGSLYVELCQEKTFVIK